MSNISVDLISMACIFGFLTIAWTFGLVHLKNTKNWIKEGKFVKLLPNTNQKSYAEFTYRIPTQNSYTESPHRIPIQEHSNDAEMVKVTGVFYLQKNEVCLK